MDKKNKNPNVPNLRFPSFSHDWKIYTFDDIASYKKGPFGSALKKDLFVPKSKESVKVYEQQNAINKDCHLERYFISANYYEKMKSFTVYPGDTIVSCAGTIGELYTLPENADIGIINQALMIIRNNQAIILKDFLNIQFSRMIDEFSKTYSNGSAIKNIPPFSDLKRKKTYVPDKLEQEKIIKFISLLDQKITTQIKIINDYKILKNHIIKSFIKQNGTSYLLSEIAELGRGRVINSAEISKQKNPIYPVYSSQTSNNGIMGYLDNYDYEGEYITWTTDGANAGTVYYRNGKFNCTNVCGILKIKNGYDAYYISNILNCYTKKYVSTNLANPKLMNNVMANIKINLPSIEQQKHSSKILQSIEYRVEIEEDIKLNLVKQKAFLLKNMFI